MSTKNIDEEIMQTPGSEGYIEQIKMLSLSSEEASTHSLELHKTLQEAILAIASVSDKISDVVENIQQTMVRSHLLSLNALANVAGIGDQDDMYSVAAKELTTLSDDMKGNLKDIVEASGTIVTDSKRCSQIIEKTTEKIEITELSAQFVNHFISGVSTRQ